ncbi:TPA: restriction endonuclease [Aeromonas veronii]|uniref:restriction endonuclease n=1 Tax=Aeromonas veronii TaxID=654 RepID=UPI00330A15EC|nr:restriction endonuclease [Aeromonas veronii]HDO1333272.1 restriction endonuclease [Aeromonas veronii]HDO1337267.1 restriction endonuclease [Aeromonas veronii]HDO1342492.1 restriction endonuclease [Aeromonas veronii]HDO1346831.1 restriction endonuclease [Aeromonas veronii]
MKEILPSYEAMMPAVLKVLADGVARTLREVFERVCQHYSFTPEQLADTLPSGRQTTLRSRVGWAKTYLVKAGLIEQPKRGICLITERGKAALVSGQSIDNHYLAQFNEFVTFTLASSESAGDTQHALGTPTDTPTPEQASTPQEQIEQALAAINQSLADDLLSEILGLSPRFFEQLVVDLMVAMGYGGSQQDAARTTRYSSDGGIDGIIKEDRLGLDSIYLQAKRYTDKTVGRPEIQSFAGALNLHKARKGVFITTSSFSREAQEYVGLIEKRIVLIDGARLASLMIEYGVGVTTRQTLTIKTLDSDYFLED